MNVCDRKGHNHVICTAWTGTSTKSVRSRSLYTFVYVTTDRERYRISHTRAALMVRPTSYNAEDNGFEPTAQQ